MKLLKSVALISLSSVLAFGTANAETKQTNQKQQSKQTQKQSQKQNQKQAQKNQKQQNNKNAPKALTAEESLKAFNDSFGIRFVGHRVANNEEGKPNLLLRYDFTNKGTKEIRAVKFIGVFTYNGQDIYAQEIPLTFDTPFKAKESVSLNIAIPLEKIPEAARPILLDSNAKIGTKNLAQVLVFTDKTGIVLK